MKNKDLEPLIELLNNQNIQYFPGVLQRNFDWTMPNYVRFFESVMGASKERNHFINGVITNLIETKNGMRYISLTDGQQRVVLLTLSLCAVCSFAKNNNIPENEFNWKYVVEDFLINPRQEGDDKYKLLLRKKDRLTLNMIVDELPLPIHNNTQTSDGKKVSPKIVKAYNYIYNQLNFNNYNEFFEKIRYLISLEFIIEPSDDENLIFSSINGTGKDLSVYDNCRSYVLSKYTMKKGEVFEEKYWDNLSNHVLKETIIRSFVIEKLNVIPKNTYEEFKKIVDSYDNKEDLQIELNDFFNTYDMLINANTNDESLNFILKGLELVLLKTQYAPLVRMYKFCEKNEINSNCLINCLQLILNVSLRTKLKMNNVISLRNVFENSIKWCKPHNLYIELYKQLRPYFISDSQFEMIISSQNFYKGDKDEFEMENKQIPSNINKITDYLLFSIENNHHGAGRINPEHYSKDHICPQTLNEYWSHFFTKEQHHDYVHMLGNITPIAKEYNSSMGNDSFDDKKNNPKGYKDDKLYLNQSIISYTNWTVDSIKHRTSILAKELCAIFRIPASSEYENKLDQSVLMEGK